MSGILRKAFWPASSNHSDTSSGDEDMDRYIAPLELHTSANNSVSFTGWGDTRPNSTLTDRSDRSCAPSNHFGMSWANNAGLPTITEQNNQIRQSSGDIDKVLMDEIRQSGMQTSGEAGNLGAHGQPNEREVNESMPGSWSFGRSFGLSRAQSVGTTNPIELDDEQEEHVSEVVKRTSQDEPQTPSKLRIREVDKSAELRTRLTSQVQRSRQRQGGMLEQVNQLTAMLEEKEVSHQEELQKQIEYFTRKLDEQAQAHAAERAAEVERLYEELQSQKAEMTKFMKYKESELAALQQKVVRQQRQENYSAAIRSATPSTSRGNSEIQSLQRTTPTKILQSVKAIKKKGLHTTGKAALLSYRNKTPISDQSTDEDRENQPKATNSVHSPTKKGHTACRSPITNTEHDDDDDDDDDDMPLDMRSIGEGTGSEDNEPLSPLARKGFASTIGTLSGLAQRLVPILVPALVPALTDGIRNALPDTQRPQKKIPKNKSRGLKELQEAQREEKEDEDSAERRVILVYLRGFFKELLKYDEDDDFIQHRPVSTDAVEAFLDGVGPGPDLSDLHFELPAGLKSQWNKEALRLLQEKFCETLLEDPNFDELPRSEKYFNKIIQERFMRLASIWRTGQPIEQRGGDMETHKDVEKRLNGRRDNTLQGYRRFTRRSTKCSGRKKIVEGIIEIKIEEGDVAGDLETWEWLRDMLEWYGQDGMSSDETDYEGLEVVYRVKILPWRRNVSKYLDIIDKERKFPDQRIYSRAGSKPVKRIRAEDNPKSDRKPLKGLPSTLYNRDWLDELSRNKRAALCVSKEQFEWLATKLRRTGVPRDRKGKERAI